MSQPNTQPAAVDDLERFEHYYLTAPDGTLRFNNPGKARLAPWFAQHGFSLQACRTEAEFKAVLRQVLAEDIVQAQAQLQDLLAAGNCSEAERKVLEALLAGRPKLEEPNP